MIIHISQIAPYALSEEDEMKLYKEIQKKDITLDFNKITMFPTPFFNAAFVRLITENEPDVFEKIKITNLDCLSGETLKYSKKQAAALSGQDTKRISKVVDKNIFDS